MGCTQEVNQLPVLTTCPVGTEKILLSGIPSFVTSNNPGGYGIISFAAMFGCIAASLAKSRKRVQFIVGDPDSIVSDIDAGAWTLPVDGDTQLIINIPNIAVDSFEITLGGAVMPRDTTDVQSATPVYSSSNIEINRYPQFNDGELHILWFDVAATAIYNTAIPQFYPFISTEDGLTDTGAIPALVNATITMIMRDVAPPLLTSQYSFDPETGRIILLGGGSNFLDIGGQLSVLFTSPISV